MLDLALNENFSVFLDDTNDLATVDGQDQFEQSVAVHLTDLLHKNVLPGMDNDGTTKNKIRLQVSRVARRHDRIEEVSSVKIDDLVGEEASYEVTIVYRTGEETTIPV